MDKKKTYSRSWKGIIALHEGDTFRILNNFKTREDQTYYKHAYEIIL